MDVEQARASLVRRIRTADPPAGALALFWLGQAGFALRGAGTTLLIDPFLVAMDSRTIPPAVDPAALDFVDGVLATHEHIDHLDRPTWPAIAMASPGARFVVPLPVVSQVHAIGLGSERVLGAAVDEQEAAVGGVLDQDHRRRVVDHGVEEGAGVELRGHVV